MRTTATYINFPFPKKKYPTLQISPKIWPHAFCPVGKYLPTKIYRNLGGGMHWCVACEIISIPGAIKRGKKRLLDGATRRVATHSPPTVQSISTCPSLSLYLRFVINPFFLSLNEQTSSLISVTRVNFLRHWSRRRYKVDWEIELVSKLNINNCLRNVEFTNNHNILYSKQFSLSLYSLEGKFESIESTNTSTSRRNYDKLKGKGDNENHCDV